MGNSPDSVKCLKTLLHTDEVRIAEFELAPNAPGGIHYHSNTTEHCFCLKGRLQVKLGGNSAQSLLPGDEVEIPAGVRHQIINTASVPSRYLVVQYGGTYDFAPG